MSPEIGVRGVKNEARWSGLGNCVYVVSVTEMRNTRRGPDFKGRS